MPIREPDDARKVDLALLGTMEIDEILYEAEGPVLFTTHNASGQLLLAYVADEAEDATWLVLSACAPHTLEALKRGSLAVRDALTSSWMWLVHRRPEASRAWVITPDHLPPAYLPAPSTPLLPEQEPVLATRAVGDTIFPGATPASVVAYVADSTRKAVKILLDFVFERPSEGRPPEDMRALYDLPVQRFAFNSFEVAFGLPPGGAEAPGLHKAAALLNQGLSWAAGVGEQPLGATSADEKSAILRAVLQLTPPPGGPITELEVSGTWMSHGAKRLTRASRRRVHGEIRRLRTDRVVQRTGRFGEVDRDNCTFTLRTPDKGAEYRGVFAEELLDDIVEYFAEDRRVTVAGVERAGRLYVTVVGPADTETGDTGS